MKSYALKNWDSSANDVEDDQPPKQAPNEQGGDFRVDGGVSMTRTDTPVELLFHDEVDVSYASPLSKRMHPPTAGTSSTHATPLLTPPRPSPSHVTQRRESTTSNPNNITPSSSSRTTQNLPRPMGTNGILAGTTLRTPTPLPPNKVQSLHAVTPDKPRTAKAGLFAPATSKRLEASTASPSRIDAKVKATTHGHSQLSQKQGTAAPATRTTLSTYPSLTKNCPKLADSNGKSTSVTQRATKPVENGPVEMLGTLQMTLVAQPGISRTIASEGIESIDDISVHTTDAEGENEDNLNDIYLVDNDTIAISGGHPIRNSHSPLHDSRNQPKFVDPRRLAANTSWTSGGYPIHKPQIDLHGSRRNSVRIESPPLAPDAPLFTPEPPSPTPQKKRKLECYIAVPPLKKGQRKQDYKLLPGAPKRSRDSMVHDSLEAAFAMAFQHNHTDELSSALAKRKYPHTEKGLPQPSKDLLENSSTRFSKAPSSSKPPSIIQASQSHLVTPPPFASYTPNRTSASILPTSPSPEGTSSIIVKRNPTNQQANLDNRAALPRIPTRTQARIQERDYPFVLALLNTRHVSSLSFGVGDAIEMALSAGSAPEPNYGNLTLAPILNFANDDAEFVLEPLRDNDVQNSTVPSKRPPSVTPERGSSAMPPPFPPRVNLQQKLAEQRSAKRQRRAATSQRQSQAEIHSFRDHFSSVSAIPYPLSSETLPSPNRPSAKALGKRKAVESTSPTQILPALQTFQFDVSSPQPFSNSSPFDTDHPMGGPYRIPLGSDILLSSTVSPSSYMQDNPFQGDDLGFGRSGLYLEGPQPSGSASPAYTPSCAPTDSHGLGALDDGSASVVSQFNESWQQQLSGGMHPYVGASINPLLLDPQAAIPQPELEGSFLVENEGDEDGLLKDRGIILDTGQPMDLGSPPQTQFQDPILDGAWLEEPPRLTPSPSPLTTSSDSSSPVSPVSNRASCLGKSPSWKQTRQTSANPLTISEPLQPIASRKVKRVIRAPRRPDDALGLMGAGLDDDREAKRKVVKQKTAASDVRGKVGPPPSSARSVWPRGATEAYCHQCRCKSSYLKMRCDECNVNYCVRCVAIRYPDLTFGEVWDGECPRCKGQCNCDVCCRKRGDTFISMRKAARPPAEACAPREPRAGPKAQPPPTKSQRLMPPAPATSALPRATHRVNGAVKFWAPVYGLDGKLLASGFVGEHGESSQRVPSLVYAHANGPVECVRRRVFVGTVSRSWSFGPKVKFALLDPAVEALDMGKGTRARRARRTYIGKKGPLFMRLTRRESVVGFDVEFDGSDEEATEEARQKDEGPMKKAKECDPSSLIGGGAKGINALATADPGGLFSSPLSILTDLETDAELERQTVLNDGKGCTGSHELDSSHFLTSLEDEDVARAIVQATEAYNEALEHKKPILVEALVHPPTMPPLESPGSGSIPESTPAVAPILTSSSSTSPL